MDDKSNMARADPLAALYKPGSRLARPPREAKHLHDPHFQPENDSLIQIVRNGDAPLRSL